VPEELTTSREEMRSLDEELQTVNHELQAKVDELSRSNGLPRIAVAVTFSSMIMAADARRAAFPGWR
jgi:two-component system CheB/CheR fusion protein